jgi:hypothetical protein
MAIKTPYEIWARSCFFLDGYYIPNHQVLFFIAVKTNVDYIIVASFVIQDKTIEYYGGSFHHQAVES